MANLPVPSPRTFGVNEIETGGFLNSLRDALLFLLNPPIGRFKQATVQSIPNGALTSVSFDATVNDSYGGHSNSTNNSRYTAIVAGWYWVFGAAAFVANGTGIRVASFAVNGTDITDVQEWFTPTAGNPCTAVAGTELFLNAGDYVELRAYQTSGGALNTAVSGPQSMLIVDWRHT